MAVFEVFFNFPSYQALHQKPDQPHWDFIILNSVSFFEKTMFIIRVQKVVALFSTVIQNDKIANKKTLVVCNAIEQMKVRLPAIKNLKDWMM
jgi:hypothetical protein